MSNIRAQIAVDPMLADTMIETTPLLGEVAQQFVNLENQKSYPLGHASIGRSAVDHHNPQQSVHPRPHSGYCSELCHNSA